MARKRTSENELVVSSGMAAPIRRKAASLNRKKHTATQPETASASAVEPLAEPAAVSALVAQEIFEPAREEIAALAYSYWEARGYQGGDPEADWIRAEQEIRDRSRAGSVAVA